MRKRRWRETRRRRYTNHKIYPDERIVVPRAQLSPHSRFIRNSPAGAIKPAALISFPTVRNESRGQLYERFSFGCHPERRVSSEYEILRQNLRMTQETN